MPTTHGDVVCVTGAGGFIGSWLVKLLLEKEYIVRCTVRNPEDPKNAHLRELEGADERLIMCRANLDDYESLREAVNGCNGVFHTASPVTDDPEQMVEPAVVGTKNVMIAAAEAKVRRVVLTSSIGPACMNPYRALDEAESCWSDLEFCKNIKNWYRYGKDVAEQAAWDSAKELGVELVVINPVLVLGPQLQPTVNASVLLILKYLNGSEKTYANAIQAYVHVVVEDVALAHILLFESPTASGGHLCAESVLHRSDVVDILVEFFPEYPILTTCSDEKNPRKKPYKFSNQKLKDLGLKFTSVKQGLYDTVKSLQENGHLPIPAQTDEPIIIQS